MCKAQFIKESLFKHRREYVAGVAAHSTDRCEECGAEIRRGPARVLVCANSHSSDQDVNAGKNLWAQMPAELRAVPGFSASVDRSQLLRCVGAVSGV